MKLFQTIKLGSDAFIGEDSARVSSIIIYEEWWAVPMYLAARILVFLFHLWAIDRSL